MNEETKFGKKFIFDSKLSNTMTFRYIKFLNILKKNKLASINFILKQLSRKFKRIKFNMAKIEFNQIKKTHLKKHNELRHILE